MAINKPSVRANKFVQLSLSLCIAISFFLGGTFPAAAAPPPQKPESTKLPVGVIKRLNNIDYRLNGAEQHISSNTKSAANLLKLSAEIFAEIEKLYAGQFDQSHPDFVVVKNRYDNLLNRVNTKSTAEAKTQGNTPASKKSKFRQSAEWVAKFKSYLSYSGEEGYDPDKSVYVPSISEPEKFAEAQRRYDAFKAFYAEYKQVEFPDGKTKELDELADNFAPARLAIFESDFSDRKASFANGADNQITAAMEQLEKDNGWQRDKNIPPPVLDPKRLLKIRDNVERVASILGNDPNTKAIRAKYAALVAKEQANRKILEERTQPSPDANKNSGAVDFRKNGR